jgi:hypothetical protein
LTLLKANSLPVLLLPDAVLAEVVVLRPLVAALVAEVDAVVEQLRKTSPNYSANSWVCRQHRPHLQHRKRQQKLHPLETSNEKGPLRGNCIDAGFHRSDGGAADADEGCCPTVEWTCKTRGRANAGRVSGDAEQILRHLPQPEG